MDVAARKVRSRRETGDAAAEDEEAAVVLGVLQAVEATYGSRRRRHGVDGRGQGLGHGLTQALTFTDDESIKKRFLVISSISRNSLSHFHTEFNIFNSLSH